MKKQSNAYTIIYALVLVGVVGVVLSVVYQALRPAQLENIANDTRRQILASAHIVPAKGESVGALYSQHIKAAFNINDHGEIIAPTTDPFSVDVASEVKKPVSERILPVFVCITPQGRKYILPVYGAGLWGPIWGYVAFDANGDTIYGAYFSHQGETPGLGAEIEKPAFQSQFEGKDIFGADGQFQSVKVVKNGSEPSSGAYVHAISGGTITSQGVQKMLADCLQPYAAFLSRLNSESSSSDKP